MVGYNYREEENVYNLVRPASAREIRPKRYQSNFARAVRAEAKTGKLAHQSMGEAHTRLTGPDEFLRKNTAEVKFRQRAKSARARREKPDPFAVTNCVPTEPHQPKRPAVPRVTDHIATPLRHRRNFVAKNALDVMCSKVDPNDDEKFVDSPFGNTQPLQKSGMAPVYSNQKTFGQIPGYLNRYREERAAEEARWEEEKRREREKIESMKLSQEERNNIIEVESQLSELEKLISLLEKHTVIIVSDEPYLSF